MTLESQIDDGHPVLPTSDEPAPERNDDTVIDETPTDEKPDSEHQEGSSEASGGDDDEHTLNESLRAEALQYGLTEDELADYDEQSLSKMLAAIDRRSLAMLQQSQSYPTGQPAVGGQQGGLPGSASFSSQMPGNPAAPPQNGYPVQQQPQQATPFELKLDEDAYDPDLIKAIKGMNEHYQTQLGQMNQALQQQQMWYQQQTEQIAEQQSAQYSAWFDNKISTLGDDYGAVFGKGSGDSLRYGSQELTNRIRLNEAVNNLAQLYPQATDDELFGRALRMEFGHLSHQIQRQQLSEQLKERSKKTLGRPGRKSTPKRHEIDPITGISQNMVAEVQDEINALIGRS